MLRLTLLFFGAAEDVPEAAKMVTAGTARLTSILKTASQGPNVSPALSRASRSYAGFAARKQYWGPKHNVSGTRA